MSWFVMVRTPHGRPVLMTDGETTVWDAKLFETYKEADATARANTLAKAFGYAVFEWDTFQRASIGTV